MDEKIERPALGSTEAAVLTVVELIARAAKMSEQHLAYWLDLYYQVRSRHEKAVTPLDLSDLMIKVEEPDPVRLQLDRIEDKLNEILDHWKHRYDAADAAAFALTDIVPPNAPAKALTLTPDDLADIGDVTEVVNDAMNKAAAGVGPGVKGGFVGFEPVAPRSKKKQKLTGADLRAVEKKKSAENVGYQWRAYKRSVRQRLSEARAQGVTASAIAEASGGKLTVNAVMDFLEAAFRPIDDYRALDAALDQLAEK